MSLTIHSHIALDQLTLGAVVLDRRGLAAIHVGPDQWMARFRGHILNHDITTSRMTLPVHVIVPPKEPPR